MKRAAWRSLAVAVLLTGALPASAGPQLQLSLLLPAPPGTLACAPGTALPAVARQLVKQALRRDPGVQRSQAEQALTEARLDQAWASLGPALRARYSYGEDNYRNISRPQGTSESQRQWVVALTQPLFDGLAGYSRVQQGREAREAARHGEQDQRAKAASATLRSYLLVLRQRELLVVAQQNLRHHQDYAVKIDALVRGKAGRVTDRELSQSRLAMALQQLMMGQGALEAAEALFQVQLGQAPAAELPPLGPDCWPLPAGIDEAMASARDGHPALAALRRQRAAADRAVDAARAARYPTVSLELTASDREDLDGVDNGFRDERSTRALVAVDYSFRSGAEEARLREMKAERSRSDAQILGETQRVESEAASAYVKLREMQRQQAVLEDRARHAEATRRGYEEQFAVGLRNLMDLLVAAAEESDAAGALLGGRYDLLQAQLAMLEAEGRLLDALDLQDLPGGTRRQSP